MSLFDDVLGALEKDGPITWERLGEILGGGTATDAGVKVNERTALRLSVVFACIRVIGETLGSLPFKLMRRLEPRGRETATQERLYRILHDEPNPEMDSFLFWELMASHACSWGGAFAEKELSQSGELLALWPLLPDRTRAVRKGGERRIETWIPETGQVSLPAERVLHIRGIGFDGLNGYSVLGHARQVIGWALGMESFSQRYFSNGLRPSLIATHPQLLSDTARKNLRREISEWNSGLDKSHRLMLLEEGVSVEKVGIPPGEAQFVETAESVAEIVARYFRMTPHKVGLMKRATFSNIEHQAIEFVVDVVRPWCRRIEAAVNSQVIAPQLGPSYFAEFLIDGLLRGDVLSRFRSYVMAISNGIYNRNEVRELENRNPIGPEGDVYTVQKQMVGLAHVLSSPGDQRSTLPGSFAPALERAAEHFVNREARAGQRMITRAFGGDSPVADLEAQLEEFYSSFPAAIEREIQPVLRSLFAAQRRPRELADVCARYYAEQHVASSRGELATLLEAGGEDLQERLEATFLGWEENRAQAIATAEVAGALSIGDLVHED